MGYSGRIIVALPGIEGDADEVLESHGFGSPVPRETRWIEAEELAGRPVPATDIDRIARNLDGPVLVADVTTSDFAIASAAAPGVVGINVILTPNAFRAEGMPLPTKAETDATYQAFAAWSAMAPRSITAADLSALVRRGATLAEDIVWELLSMLGIIPPPAYESATPAGHDVLTALKLDELGGYVRPTADMTDRSDGSPGRDWANERFVMGSGDGFVGVWDRRRPDAPVFRFEQNARGWDRALEAWADMTTRLDLGRDADEFAGLIGIDQSAFFPGGRWLAPKDWRYIPGWGDGFTAVWDREVGPEPIIRFKGRSQKSKDLAVAWARDATMRLLAARKELGPERWVCAHREVPWDSNGHTRAKLFLVAYEDADATWSPHGLQDFERDGYLLHEVWRLTDGFDIAALPERASADPESCKQQAMRWQARGDWVLVPDAVPRNLLETAIWAVEESPFAASLVPFARR